MCREYRGNDSVCQQYWLGHGAKLPLTHEECSSYTPTTKKQCLLNEGSAMNPEMVQKINDVLERIRDPESGLPVARLGLVKRFRYSEKEKILYIFTDAYRHLPHCITCAAIARVIMQTIIRDLTAALQKEFPDLSIEFV
jgi:hypothetical protein